ncbi:MAG TPA: 50S ribosomal protein L23 [Candidatus Paceibacterota bacterium]|nr:50S ribosomal protein L23 [Candidatus Paceibacterota bacterium]
MALFGTTSKKQKKDKVAKKRIARASKSANGVAHDIVRAPWFSEKALLGTEKGVYAFAIPASATKASVAGAIKELYNVSPKQVRIVNTPGKRKNMRTRRGFGVRASRRKAYVYLNQGDTIQFA